MIETIVKKIADGQAKKHKWETQEKTSMYIESVVQSGMKHWGWNLEQLQEK